MTTVVAGGDSFIYGSELKDCNFYTHSGSTFTALLAEGHEYLCVAGAGYSNSSIARTVITQCEGISHNDLFVIVSWTFPARYEFRFNYDTREKNSPWYTINAWTIENDFDKIKNEFVEDNHNVFRDQVRAIQRAKTTGVQEFANYFYKHVGSSEYWEMYTTLKEMVYLQNYLRLNHIPYMFTCADNSILENFTAQNPDYTITSLLNQINKHRDHWYMFPAGMGTGQTTTPRGFYQWAVENKYPIGTTHPLEQAHEDAAKLMQETFNELVKKSV